MVLGTYINYTCNNISVNIEDFFFHTSVFRDMFAISDNFKSLPHNNYIKSNQYFIYIDINDFSPAVNYLVKHNRLS